MEEKTAGETPDTGSGRPSGLDGWECKHWRDKSEVEQAVSAVGSVFVSLASVFGFKHFYPISPGLIALFLTPVFLVMARAVWFSRAPIVCSTARTG